jgi:hypothetical protein
MIRTMMATGLMLACGGSLALAAPGDPECEGLRHIHELAAATQEATNALVQACTACESNLKNAAMAVTAQLTDAIDQEGDRTGCK